MCADPTFTTAASFGAYTTQGLLDIATEDDQFKSGDSIIAGVNKVFTYPAADLVGLKTSSVFTVGGTQYAVRSLKLEGDGMVAKAYLGPTS